MDILVLPDDLIVAPVMDLITTSETESVANHSIRSYLFARLFADHLGAALDGDYDPRLLFASCVLHDIGLSPQGNGNQRFEVDGADLAAGFLTARGFPAADVDAVWDAIALHTSPGIAERKGTLCYLTRVGIAIDFGMGSDMITDTQAAAIHAAYPRLSMARSVADAIVEQTHNRPEKAPLYTTPGELARERSTEPFLTRMEQAAASSRWGD